MPRLTEMTEVRADFLRGLMDELFSGAYGFKDMEEILPRQLASHEISDEQWAEFMNFRRPLERSLEEVGAAGISVADLAAYHDLSTTDLEQMLASIGAVKGEDGRCRLRGPLPGSLHRRNPHGGWVVGDVRSPVQKLLDRTGAEGMTLSELTTHLPEREALALLEGLKAVKGSDGRYRRCQRLG